MSSHIVGVYVGNRVQSAQEMQNLLTQYGCNIKTRLGLHEVNNGSCAQSGLIILEVFGEGKAKLISALKDLNGVIVKEMVF